MSNFLFQTWILSFLLYQVDIVGTLSVDNLLVPVLVLVWFFVGEPGSARVRQARARTILLTALVFFALIVIDLAKLEGGADFGLVVPSVVGHLKHYGYILVPLLYISSEKALERGLLLLLVVTVINSGSAFLGAIGMAPSFVEASDQHTRIPGLLRSRGPIANLGDSALLIASMGVMVWTLARHKIRFIKAGTAFKTVIFAILLAGIVASQSRNVILTVALVFAVYYWLRSVLSGNGGGTRVLLPLLGVGVFLAATVAVVLNADAIIAGVTNMFGASGEGTVRDRLQSYEEALDLLDNAPLAGLSATQMADQSLFIASIHNMWLGIALSSGLLGVMLLFGLLTSGLMGALHLTRNVRWKEYGLVMMSLVLAALMFSPNFYPGHNAFIFWFFVGMVLTTHQTLHFSPQPVHGKSGDAVGEAPAAADGVRPKSRILRYKG